MKRYSKAMSELIHDHKASGGNFFNPDTMAYWNSRIGDYPVSRSNDDRNRRFFITSERMDETEPERFTIRYATTDPATNKTSIETFGEFQAYDSLGDAAYGVTNIFDLALDVGWATVVDIADLR